MKMHGVRFRLTSMVALLALLLIVADRSWAHSSEEPSDDDDLDIVVEDEDDMNEYESPTYDPAEYHFIDTFDNHEESRSRWKLSNATKDDESGNTMKYNGTWEWQSAARIGWKKNLGLVLTSQAKHAAIAAHLREPFEFKGDKPLVVQYEVNMQRGQECGGAYLKLLSAGKGTGNLAEFHDKTSYTIMFGPDKCGREGKIHFIFRHRNPKNGSFSEKNCRQSKKRLEDYFTDKLPHLYTLIVSPNNTYQIRLDHEVINEGSLLSDFTPPVNPPAEIDDETQKKPEDWDEREKIPDPTVEKPDDWDKYVPRQIPDMTAVMPDGWLENEPKMIPDPNAKKPQDWNNDMDGEWEDYLIENPVCEEAPGCGKWERPLIPNPEYKGKWQAPLIDNPNYKGKWAPPKIPNPEYFEDLTPFKMTPISAVGIEIWSMTSDILFDNILVTDDVSKAEDFAAKTFDVQRRSIDKKSESYLWNLLSNFSDYMWVWKIAIVLTIAPIVYALVRKFSKRSKKEPAQDAKKTDAPQEDDVAAVDEVDTETVAHISESSSSPKSKKSDLDLKGEDVGPMEEPQEMESTPALQVPADGSDEESGGEHAGADADADDDDEKDKGNEEGSKSPVSAMGARKRRVRKDEY